MSPPTSQNIAEFDELLNIYVEKRPMRVLEIGTHDGGTLYYWLKFGLPKSVVASIDLQGIVTHETAAKWAAPEVTTLLFKGDSTSQEAITWATDNIGKVDWLFIDGGHDYKTVKADWNNYFPLVNPGGVIAFHDICPHEPYEGQLIEVDRFWNEIKNSGFQNTQEIIEENIIWGGVGPGIGVIYL